MNVKALIPWRFKIIGKLMLSRIPSCYRLWQRIGLFKHGQMEQPVYAYSVFKRHFERVDFPRKGQGFVALELGPGDSLFSALITHAFGASSSYLVDVGRFALGDLAPYKLMMDYLQGEGLPVPDLNGLNSLDDMLGYCNAQYGTKGIKSLREIPDRTVDFVWSQAVLEHIRRDEFIDTMLELWRVLRPDGVCSQRVDLRDHLGGAVNNLRFSRNIWESDFIARSGFYTNRIRYTEMLDFFYSAGFDVNIIKVERWDKLPTPCACLSKQFKDLPEEELRISGFDVVCRPR